MFLITQDLESPSGIGRYFPLSKYLVDEGFSVTIAALHSNYKSLKYHQIEKEGVTIKLLSQMHVKKIDNQTIYFKNFKLIWVTIKATWKLLIYLLKNPADVVVIGKPHPMNSIAGLLGGNLVKAKIILDCDDYEAESNYFNTSWQHWIIRFFENLMPSLVNHVTTNTIFNKTRMINLGIPEKRIHYLPNGVDSSIFNKPNPFKSTELSTNFGINENKVVSYIGSLNLSNHPVDLLLKAFKIIKSQLIYVSLLIIGGGKDFQKLRKLSSDLEIDANVIFVGKIPQDLIPDYYSMTDVIVDPVYDTDSAKGRCPLKIFESWAMGIPLVTSDVGDRSFLAGNSQTILLAKPGDPCDLAKKINMILTNPELSSLMKLNGNERVRSFYWKNIVKNNWEIFTKDGN